MSASFGWMVVHQPIEVRRFAQLKRWRAKNDRLDARLIAAARAQVEAVKAAQDPRLVELAERLTAYEQITDQAAQLKTFLESVSLKDLIVAIRAQIATLTRLKAKLAAEVLRRIKAEPDLLARLRLLISLPGAADAAVRDACPTWPRSRPSGAALPSASSPRGCSTAASPKSSSSSPSCASSSKPPTSSSPPSAASRGEVTPHAMRAPSLPQ